MPRAIAARQVTPLAKLRLLSWPFVVLVLLLAVVGYGVLYSAAGGAHAPWAWRHGVRLSVGIAVMLGLALVDCRVWFRHGYLLYALGLVGLLAVEFAGHVSMGAQRWIDLGLFRLQPSETMKIVLVIALARYFHATRPEELTRPLVLLPPVLMILLPAALVLRQPDLGTAIMLLAGGAIMLFAAGVAWWQFALVAGAGLAALPMLWPRLHDYQRQRVLTFLDPERDPLGAGYHILQSKIAFGAGGVFGRGFLQGTQSQLSFLPEKHTDFVFAMLAEEAGLLGALGLLGLFLLVTAYGLVIALRTRHQFGRLLATGVTATFFLYIVINIAMVTGLVPVVGVPLPLISYGGTAMLTVLIGFGLLLGVDLHRDAAVPRFPASITF